MSNRQKTLDNRQVKTFLDGFLTPFELCRDYPFVDDILSGVLELKSERNTATRSLSRRTLFTILQQCDTIDVPSLMVATGGRYKYATLAAYAASARVASKAIQRFIGEAAPRDNLADARRQLDEPFHALLRGQLQFSNLEEGDERMEPLMTA